MDEFCSHFVRCLRDDQGQALTEYALISFAFTCIMFGALNAMQQGTGHNLNTTQTNLSGLYVNP